MLSLSTNRKADQTITYVSNVPCTCGYLLKLRFPGVLQLQSLPSANSFAFDGLPIFHSKYDIRVLVVKLKPSQDETETAAPKVGP